MQIGVIGLGLIGGSIAMAISQKTGHCVWGMDVQKQAETEAQARGWIIGALTRENLAQCDLVLIALYPRQTVEWMQQWMECLRPGTVIMDLCGVKQWIAEQLAPLARQAQCLYIGGHPMAGREQWGWQAVRDGLFDGASMILVPEQDTPPEVLAQMEQLFLSVGFGSIQKATAAHHDRMIAYTSQLAHVVSGCYIMSDAAPFHHGFSAGSYRDMTRVATLNEHMWTQLFLANAPALTEQIDQMIDHLQQYRTAVAERDESALRQIMAEGRERKEQIDRKRGTP